MCKDDIRNSNRKIIELGDLGYLTLITNLVERIWTFSRSLINPSLCGFHTEFAYSKWDCICIF